MSFTFTRRADITDPEDRLAWRTFGGVLRNFTGWAFTMEVLNPTNNTIQYNKTDGIAGGDGTGLSNVAIAWTEEEMTPLAGRKRWKGRLLATFEDQQAEFVLDKEGTLPVWIFEVPPELPPEPDP